MILTITPKLVMAELRKRGYAPEFVHDHAAAAFIRFVDDNGDPRYIAGMTCDKTNGIAYRIAGDKLAAGSIAARLGIATPETEVYGSDEQAAAFLAKHRQIVVKPLDAAHGNGVTVTITTIGALRQAISSAREFSDTVLLQRHVHGRDLRLLYIGGAFCAATERRPASVTGDGQHTLRELITRTNADPKRGENYEKQFNRIPLAVAEVFLGEKIDTYVPAQGEEVAVVGTANIGTGGTAIDVTDTVNPRMVESGQRIITELRMDVCGADFIESEDGFYLIEINGSPSAGMHHFPHEGRPRDVVKLFVDWLLTRPA